MVDKVKVPKHGRATSLWFRDRVEARFDFLLADGFLGPERSDLGLTYHAPPIAVSIDYHEFGSSVEAVVHSNHDGDLLHARLSVLVVEAALDSAQCVKTEARTTHALEVALDSQAAALRRLMPKLRGSEAKELLSSCQGR